MDYMQELASHPDMPQALDALRRRWQQLFDVPHAAAPHGTDVDALKEKWVVLFGTDSQPVPASAADFTELMSRWQCTRRLVEEGLTDPHQNVQGVQYLIKEHPNVWIAQVVHEFYLRPGLAADAWLELRYCDRFRAQLAKRVIARVGHAWFKGQAAHQEAKRVADTLLHRGLPVEKVAGNAEAAERANVRLVSDREGLVHEPPQFIKDLIERKIETDSWFKRTRPPGGVTEEQLAYGLIADPNQASELARKFSVPVPFSMMLQGELEQIRQTREWVCATPEGERVTSTPRHPMSGEHAGQGAPIRQAFREDLLGLAFSGGGIRSATFNLGVLQALAKIGMLKHCDYLSTVSGGGYIGGWFTAWMHRQSGTRPRKDAINDMQRRLSPVRNANPVAGAVRPIRYLREYSNYLTPRTGFLSADTWTMIGIFTRNALLNQVILVSLFAGLLLLPRAIVKLFGAGAGHAGVRTDWFLVALIGALVSVATWILIKNLRRLDPQGSEDRMERSASTSMTVEPEVPLYARPLAIQFGVVLPWLLAVSVLVLRFPDIVSVLPADRVAPVAASLGWPLLIATVVAAFAAIYVALLLGFGKAARCWSGDHWGLVRSFGSAVVVGGAAAGAVALALIHLFRLAELDQGLALTWHAAVLGGPAAMLVISLLIVVVLGMLGEKFPDEHREWWSRLRTFIHMYALGCLAWFAFALYVPWARRCLEEAELDQWSGVGALVAWAGSTFAGVKAGGSAETKNGNGDAPPSSIVTTLVRGIAFVAPYVFVVGLIVAISLVLDVIVHHDNPTPGLTGGKAYWTYVTQWNDAGGWMLALTLGCFALGLMFSSRVDINAFSMHHFYKNRLVRCYLGASHDERKADWFTGFDPDDDVRLAKLDHANASDDADKYPGPYPIVNCALNLVGGKDLAWQERKAESFVFTPKYCGFDLDRAVLNKSTSGYAEAYAPTKAFYRNGEGPLLGMAMAISGAAANPNMGQATSPASAFLLTVFNARLGWWVGNTRNRKSAARPGPPFGLAYTARELTGSTDDEQPYVNVSDGGHFDNLGVYELIRRGCRYVIACDAGQDGEFAFQDLGSLVRRCRTDFGVEIDISLDRIRNRDSNAWSQVHCVVGTIHYLNIPKRDWRGQLLNEDDLPLRPGDRPAHEKGYLIYLKPSITGDEPHDVLEYGHRVPEFPHESTADQWFGEGQFEAYRRLGMHIGEHAFNRFQNDDRRPIRDIGWLFERLHKFWYPPTTVIGQHSTENTRVYSTIMERVRTLPHLGFLDHTLFDGLPGMPLAWSGGSTLSQDEQRSEFYVVNSLIQLMEDVYADLHLEDNFDHPHVEGWMTVFRRWTMQEAFQRTWAISRGTYAERFRRFYDDRLSKRRPGRRPLTFPTRFISSHRGRVSAGSTGNLMTDFEKAVQAKADVIEVDVRKLKDDTLVVFHDVAFGGHPLSTVDYTAFLKLPGASAVPTLSDCLTTLRGRVQLDIELKDTGSVEKVLELIRKTAWNTDDFVLTSAHPEVPLQARALREDVQAGLVIEAGKLPAEARRVMRSPAIDFISPEHGSALTLELLDECAACGMPVVPWTVNAEAAIQDLFKHPAVAGVITDEVALAQSARQSVR